MMNVRALALGVGLALVASAGRAEKLSPSPAPDFVVQMAIGFVRGLPGALSRGQRDAAQHVFERAFIFGYIGQPYHAVVRDATDMSSGGSDAAAGAGSAAGERYMRDYPTSQPEIMPIYGYTAIEATGQWISGFEASLFVNPSNSDNPWWLSLLPGAKVDPKLLGRSNGVILSENRQVQVRGWLSPPGRYGHMNLRDRELFATEISAVVSASTGSASTPPAALARP